MMSEVEDREDGASGSISRKGDQSQFDLKIKCFLSISSHLDVTSNTYEGTDTLEGVVNFGIINPGLRKGIRN